MTSRRLFSLVTGILLSIGAVAGAVATGVIRWRHHREEQKKVADARRLVAKFALAARQARARGVALPASISPDGSGSVALLARGCGGLAVVAGESGNFGGFG